jgi:protein-S-isoprenylcysteine O-methyltransferase Ste14
LGLDDPSKGLRRSGHWWAGEILMAVGLALPGSPTSWLPWLYPLYYVLLLVPRERDDNRRCAEKYAQAWDEYTSLVSYRIVPFVY